MRRVGILVALIALASLVAASYAWAETHSFRLWSDAHLNGTKLTAGSYRLELTGQGEALIYRGRELLTKARAEVRPLGNGSNPGSVLVGSNAEVREIRLKKSVVVFVR